MLDFAINEERCTQCAMCVTNCPVRIIEMPKGKYPTIIEGVADRCLKCLHCLTVCPSGALSILGNNPDDSTLLKGNLPQPKQIETLLKGRRTVRRFKQEELPREQIEHLLSVTANAPSGKNRRPWHFTLMGQEALQKIRPIMFDALEKLLQEQSFQQKYGDMSSLLKLWRNKGIDLILRNAPHLLLVSTDHSKSSTEADAYIALTYFDIYSSALGIGSFWNGFFMHIVKHSSTVREALHLSQEYQPIYALSFGKPAVKYFRTAERNDFKASWL